MSPEDLAWIEERKKIHARIRAGLAPHDPVGGPTLPQMAAGFAGSMAKWVRGGLRRVPENTYQARKAVCLTCEHWDDQAGLGMGRCRKCGCTGGKLWLPHEKCPVGKWGPENLAPTEGSDPG